MRTFSKILYKINYTWSDIFPTKNKKKQTTDSSVSRILLLIKSVINKFIPGITCDKIRDQDGEL